MPQTPNKGPWTQRFLLHVFTILFGLLSYWLLGFVIDDISHWPGPEYQALEQEMLDGTLTAESERLGKELADVRRNIQTEQARQRILQDSTGNAQTTMTQLLEFQRMSLEKGLNPTEEEQLALAESQKRFLGNQSRYQELTEEIATLEEKLRDLERENQLNQEKLDTARKPIWEEFSRRQQSHAWLLAGIKLAVLTPLLILAVVVFLKNRESLYVSMVTAFAIAVAAKVLLVMHEYFPARFFKYVLIVTFLAIVTRALIVLIRTIAFPKAEWLHKRYREAYEAFLCPICDFPIRRGPLKYLFWTRRTIKKVRLSGTEEAAADEPYCCPACGTELFEKCGSCGQVRHSLLPTCEHCGNSRPVGTSPSGPGPTANPAPA